MKIMVLLKWNPVDDFLKSFSNLVFGLKGSVHSSKLKYIAYLRDHFYLRDMCVP